MGGREKEREGGERERVGSERGGKVEREEIGWGERRKGEVSRRKVEETRMR